MKSYFLIIINILNLCSYTIELSKTGKDNDKNLPIANNMFPLYYNYPFNLIPPQFLYQGNNFQFPFPNFNMSMTSLPLPISFLKQKNETIISNKTKIANKTKKFIPKPIKKKNLAAFKCHPSDIYCLCKFHPKYHDCVCLAYPRSVACSETFCTENPNSYECNPQFCDKKENFIHKNCYCKRNIDSIGCKCKLNPLDKECFCMKFPSSHLCNERICKYNPNSLYCKCKISPKDPICSPKFCVTNPKSPQCECIMFPYNSNCGCLNDPNSCSSDQVKSKIIELDMRIRGMCNNNSTKNDSINETENEVNNNTIYNLYYPPCIYNRKNKPKNSPCLPAPAAEKCDKDGNCFDKRSLSPCLSKICKKNRRNNKGKVKDKDKKKNKKSSSVNRRLKGLKNKKCSPIEKRITMLR